MAAVQSIYQYWKQFDLPTLQKELDDVAAEVANRQDESETSRKKLVELSRDFKKNTPEDVRKVVTPLLKSFQGEVDSLCKRSKAAEAAFLSLYKKIVETPDPTSALENAAQWQKKAQRLQDLEIENANLKETLNEYNSEFAEVKNQEVTIRQLKEKIKGYEEQIETTVATKLSEKEATLSRQFDEREKEFIENNNILAAKFSETENRADALQSSLNAAQQELFVLRSRSDEVGSAKSSEMDMLMSDLEKANIRAASAERECELLKESLKTVETSLTLKEKETDGVSQQSVEIEMSMKDRQISQLLEEISQLNSKTAKENAEYDRKLEEMAKQLVQKTQTLQSLEEKLETRSDYDEIKRELSIMKTVYLGADESDANETISQDSKNLEVLLLEKNKSLQVEQASLRSSKRELENVRRRNSVTSAFTVGCSRPRCLSSSHQLKVLNKSNEQSSSLTSLESASNQIPLRSVVERMACLIGTELVNQYEAKTDRHIKKELDVAQAQLSTDPTSEDTVERTMNAVVNATAAFVNAKEPSQKSSRSRNRKAHASSDPPLTNIEEALNSGVPREIIECIAIQHLQQALALNVNKIKIGTPLNTTQIANHCRQVLNTYNIGQRLLAKCVLNQSQGAVSELLSKPKTWDKLTEKGKESFRRLQAWLGDEASISILRMISPKRAYGGFRERYPPKPEDRETQEKISAILSAAKEAQRRVQRQSVASKLKIVPLNHETSVAAAMTPSPVGSSLSSNGGDIADKQNSANKHRSSGRYRHDDIPKEMIFEIYKRELAKLREQEHCFQDDAKEKTEAESPEPVFSDDPPPPKIAKLSQASSSETVAKETVTSTPTTSRNRRKATHVVRVSPSHVQTVSNSSFEVKQQLKSAFNIVKKSQQNLEKRCSPSFPRPRRNSENHSTAKATVQRNSAASSSKTSLKHIDTITSTLSQALQGFNLSPTPVGTKAFKAILTPITQDQFEAYGEVNTEDLVKEVKDYLSQFSISQRLFGEQVLGLSQGSVSDLLARPKPWNMLTQKGREPFIRMQIFMEDKDALKKLLSRRAKEQQNGEGSENSNDEASAIGISTPPPLPVERCDSVSSDGESYFASKPEGTKEKGASKVQQSNANSGNNTIIPLDQIKTMQRELEEYDIQLDTQSIVRQVKEILLTHNIGQKVFEAIRNGTINNSAVYGEAVLGMSQGAVSDLLAKSKPWPNLSAKGKEAFVRMHLWLQDPSKIEKVFEYRTNRDELNQLQTEHKAMVISFEQQKQLINNLEEDLLRVQNFKRTEAEGSASPDESPDEVISHAVGNAAYTTNMTIRSGPNANADSLLPIVSSQRERFRLRVQELEEQNLQQQEHMALLTSEMERMRSDNVKLYEKIKFLQTYRGNQPLVTATDETLNRYSTEYEASLDPFQRFGVQERTRRYMALRTHDKATLNISRVIMSNGMARAAFFFYLIFLHCLVFLVLYKLAYTESCRRDVSTDCVEKYREHMQLVHGKDVHG